MFRYQYASAKGAVCPLFFIFRAYLVPGCVAWIDFSGNKLFRYIGRPSSATWKLRFHSSIFGSSQVICYLLDTRTVFLLMLSIVWKCELLMPTRSSEPVYLDVRTPSSAHHQSERAGTPQHDHRSSIEHVSTKSRCNASRVHPAASAAAQARLFPPRLY